MNEILYNISLIVYISPEAQLSGAQFSPCIESSRPPSLLGSAGIAGGTTFGPPAWKPRTFVRLSLSPRRTGRPWRSKPRMLVPFGRVWLLCRAWPECGSRSPFCRKLWNFCRSNIGDLVRRKSSRTYCLWYLYFISF